MQNRFIKGVLNWSILFLSMGWIPIVHAQSAPNDATSGKVSAFKQPQLLEGGGQAGLVRAIQLGVIYPKSALRYGIQGQCQVTFVVAPNGQVGRVKISRSVQADIDTAVAVAVRRLPRLEPGMQDGKPVACILTAPVTFLVAPAKPTRKKLPAADSTQLYTAVNEMPFYKGQPALKGFAADLLAGYLKLGGTTGCFVPRTNLGLLVTVGPSGTLYDWERIKTAESECDALRAAYGDAVAQNDEEELPAECLALLARASLSLPRLVPATADGRRVAMRVQVTLLAPQ